MLDLQNSSATKPSRPSASRARRVTKRVERIFSVPSDTTKTGGLPLKASDISSEATDCPSKERNLSGQSGRSQVASDLSLKAPSIPPRAASLSARTSLPSLKTRPSSKGSDISLKATAIPSEVAGPSPQTTNLLPAVTRPKPDTDAFSHFSHQSRGSRASGDKSLQSRNGSLRSLSPARFVRMSNELVVQASDGSLKRKPYGIPAKYYLGNYR